MTSLENPVPESAGFSWLGIGGAFESEGDWNAFQRFMSRTGAAESFLDRGVDAAAWKEASCLEGIFLTLRPGDLDEPDITDLGVEDGVHSFLVTYRWLSDEFADRLRGPWQLIGVLCVVLATISREAGIPLPRLPVPR